MIIGAHRMEIFGNHRLPIQVTGPPVRATEITGNHRKPWATGPPIQATGPPQMDAGVGIGMKIKGNLIIFNGKGH